MKKLICFFVVLFCFFVEGMSQTVRSFQREDNRVVLEMTDGELQLYPLSPNTLRVKFVKQSVGMEMPEWIYVNSGKEETFTIEEDKDAVSVVLPGIVAQVEKESGLITFLSPAGDVILQEEARLLTPSAVQGIDTYCATQKFYSPEDEHLFGLGQFQDGGLRR